MNKWLFVLTAINLVSCGANLAMGSYGVGLFNLFAAGVCFIVSRVP